MIAGAVICVVNTPERVTVVKTFFQTICFVRALVVAVVVAVAVVVVAVAVVAVAVVAVVVAIIQIAQKYFICIFIWFFVVIISRKIISVVRICARVIFFVTFNIFCFFNYHIYFIIFVFNVFVVFF